MKQKITHYVNQFATPLNRPAETRYACIIISNDSWAGSLLLEIISQTEPCYIAGLSAASIFCSGFHRNYSQLHLSTHRTFANKALYNFGA